MTKRVIIFLLSALFVSLVYSEERIFSHEGLDRTYQLYLPENLKREAPLVVVIHGYTSSAENIMSYSRMNEVADREGFAVVYPQGTIDSQGNAFFNVGYEFNQASKINDVSVIRELVLYLR